MKKWICILLAAVMLLALAACGGAKQGGEKPAENTPAPTPEVIRDWTRAGYFEENGEPVASVDWIDLDNESGWYVVCLIDGDFFGGFLPQEGNSLRGALKDSEGKDGPTVTVTEEGADGLLIEVEGGKTYHVTPMDIPEAIATVRVNTEGVGQVAYAAAGEELDFDEGHYTSHQFGIAEPGSYTFGAQTDEEGWAFIKWTLNGEDYTDEPIFTAEVAEDMELVAVFEYVGGDGQNPVMNFIGPYVCERARALVECIGDDGAQITIEWSDSVWSYGKWVITGPLDTDTLTVDYSGCVMSVVTVDEDGEIAKEEVLYEDGTGSIVFGEDGTFVWHEDGAEHDDMTFEYAFSFEDDEDGQNPVMNFIGPYVCERAHALVECSGSSGAKITIEWGDSVMSYGKWEIEGYFDPDTMTVDYYGCVMSLITVNQKGETVKEEVRYEDGTGTVVFGDDGTFVWHEDGAEHGDMTFEWHFPAEE